VTASACTARSRSDTLRLLAYIYPVRILAVSDPEFKSPDETLPQNFVALVKSNLNSVSSE